MKARCIQDSKVFNAPPHIREVWDWILMQCNHEDTNVCKRGQCIRTVKEIQEDLKWFVGYRKVTYKITQCENAMKWLRVAGMVATTKTTRGSLITVCNYDTYQDACRYGSQNGSPDDAEAAPKPRRTINKNVRTEEVIILWRNSFEDYKDDLRAAFTSFVNDPEKVSDLEKALPDFDIVKTLNKAIREYWATKDGWEKKRKSKAKKIDWDATFRNASRQEWNQVVKKEKQQYPI